MSSPISSNSSNTHYPIDDLNPLEQAKVPLLSETQSEQDEKIKTIRSSWLESLKNVVFAPFRAIRFVAQSIGRAINSIKTLANSILLKKEDIDTVSSQKEIKTSIPQKHLESIDDQQVSKNLIQELILKKGLQNTSIDTVYKDRSDPKSEKIDVEHAFEREVIGSMYFFNDELLITLEDKSSEDFEGRRYLVYKKLKEELGETGFTNVSRLLNQTITTDISDSIKHNHKAMLINRGMRFSIQTEKDLESGKNNVKLIIENESQLIPHHDYPTEQEVDDVPERFFSYRREIAINHDELSTNWDKTSQNKILPNTTVTTFQSKIADSLEESTSDRAAQIEEHKKALTIKEKKNQ